MREATCGEKLVPDVAEPVIGRAFCATRWLYPSYGSEKIFHAAGDLAWLSSLAWKNILVLFAGKSPAYSAYPVPKEGR